MKKGIVKGYKGFDKGLNCRGFQYKIGKTYTYDGVIEPCASGFHFCREFKDVDSFYRFDSENNTFAEVEALGKIIDDKDGIKSVTNKIKIVREISREEMLRTLNVGINNTGFFNTGYRNTGYSNTGDSNTGDRNTGYRNTGNSNTGDSNTGYRNTGDNNTGYSNTGDSNTGDSNTGYSNTGDSNTGDRNTGDSNTGDRNTGDFNKTNRSAGVFCTKKPEMILFNKKTSMTFEEWKETRAYNVLCDLQKSQWIYFSEMNKKEKENYIESAETCDGYLKEISRKEASMTLWNSIDIFDKHEIVTLPNFDLNIFNEIMELNITIKEYKEILKNGNK